MGQYLVYLEPEGNVATATRVFLNSFGELLSQQLKLTLFFEYFFVEIFAKTEQYTSPFNIQHCCEGIVNTHLQRYWLHVCTLHSRAFQEVFAPSKKKSVMYLKCSSLQSSGCTENKHFTVRAHISSAVTLASQNVTENTQGTSQFSNSQWREKNASDIHKINIA